jgi:protein SCO1/2
MISVDGERDTPEVLSKFLGRFSRNIQGGTGDPLAVRDIAARFKAVFFKDAPLDHSAGYRVDHTSQVYLVDRRGRLRATFFGAPSEAIVSVTRRIAAEGD